MIFKLSHVLQNVNKLHKRKFNKILENNVIKYTYIMYFTFFIAQNLYLVLHVVLRNKGWSNETISNSTYDFSKFISKNCKSVKFAMYNYR